jgi:hypothetical protein
MAVNVTPKRMAVGRRMRALRLASSLPKSDRAVGILEAGLFRIFAIFSETPARWKPVVGRARFLQTIG